ncbi:hypothetical protein M2451_003360 [Dysgonomonas sp. PFB1-18]|nr:MULTISPECIES: hypothetical protein [unclassified Dysgonomonas]MDH6310550.1 hypothetical protein [Dysgonomonas sp. PF1-14]MDH6340400.1 hypothetical protein [Dysgonomonas sp. PF1-16]MDH6382020.1 hypothetical protein [Dysgonomonas sp. PFB1-18]MDH6399371.1 hypothetical protein [Dysgonomonas sp. PF1-23]
MKKENMKKENIDNLTSLWTLTGTAFDAYQSVYGFETVNIGFSE